mmetsp:Transcript_15103/g.48155  ORF Transcript_15103/g.48155 Transcript_15103/m.48155 type:complete len:299 (-) Transcript_15103:32-928(-)
MHVVCMSGAVAVKSCATCLASSRVGARHSTRGARPRAPDRPDSRIRSTTGITNASVLPQPVRARPMMSLPALMCSKVRTWMGNRCVMPRSRSAPSVADDSPNRSNGTLPDSSASVAPEPEAEAAASAASFSALSIDRVRMRDTGAASPSAARRRFLACLSSVLPASDDSAWSSSSSVDAAARERFLTLRGAPSSSASTSPPVSSAFFADLLFFSFFSFLLDLSFFDFFSFFSFFSFFPDLLLPSTPSDSRWLPATDSTSAPFSSSAAPFAASRRLDDVLCDVSSISMINVQQQTGLVL